MRCKHFSLALKKKRALVLFLFVFRFGVHVCLFWSVKSSEFQPHKCIVLSVASAITNTCQNIHYHSRIAAAKAFYKIFSFAPSVSPPSFAALICSVKAFTHFTNTHTQFLCPSRSVSIERRAFAFRICNIKTKIPSPNSTSNQQKFSLLSLFSANTYKRPSDMLCALSSE